MSGEAHLYETIIAYKTYRKQLRELPVYTGYDDFTRRQNDGERQRLAQALKDVENSLQELVNRYHPELAGEPIDIMIAELTEKLPQDNTRMARVVNARGSGMP